MIGNILNPFVMKFRGISWQIWVYLFDLTVYITGALVLSISFGLYGFCIAALAAAFARLMILAIVWIKCEKSEKTTRI